jgi:hypothetical protein
MLLDWHLWLVDYVHKFSVVIGAHIPDFAGLTSVVGCLGFTGSVL